MKTVKEVCRRAGVSVRTLHHYDEIGLLKPARVTEAGYRLYDGEALERLYLILLFRELGFPLKEIRTILDAPDFDRGRVLDTQIALLEQKRAHLQNLITLAKGVKLTGVSNLDFTKGFDPKMAEDYSAQAETLWGKTDAWKEYKQKSAGRSRERENALGGEGMEFFVRLGALRDTDPAGEAAQAWVAELQAFFTAHYYNCTPQILLGLGQMYADGGSMTENIDNAGGKGTGAFAKRAIEIYCGK